MDQLKEDEMHDNRKLLQIYVPKKIDSDWDLETFYLREHLFDLISSYGIEILRDELRECENFLNKKNKE